MKTTIMMMAIAAVMTSVSSVYAYDIDDLSYYGDLFSHATEWTVERTDAAGNVKQLNVSAHGKEFVLVANSADVNLYPEAVIVNVDVCESGAEENVSTYTIGEIYGNVFCYDKSTSEATSVFNFDVNSGDNVIMGNSELPVSNIDYVRNGRDVARRIKCADGENEIIYLTGVGANQFSVADADGNLIRYRILNVKNSADEDVDMTIFSAAHFVPDNEFFTDEKRWEFKLVDAIWQEEEGQKRYWVDGDENLDGVVCRTVKSEDMDANQATGENYRVCSDAGQIFVYCPYRRTFDRVIDFDVNAGDCIRPYLNATINGVSNESILGINRKLITGSDDLMWIDGIGSVNHHFNTCPQLIVPTCDVKLKLMSAYENDKQIYGESTAIEDLPSESVADTPKAMYDPNGQLVSQPGHGSVYITEGKKILKK